MNVDAVAAFYKKIFAVYFSTFNLDLITNSGSHVCAMQSTSRSIVFVP